ncbi:uncharacterized protein LOC120293469 [Eucalyptus grandis]|uniref:uncharacterized protein LOC120293469 n=1 Tax=Eucalyptus grandis TaxID=71139 RepID=UPI00192EAA7C|nr:uncharacterized protein LOC120293469 [Eucalyptus grandis]
MADQIEMRDRMTAVENQLQQLLTSMQLMTDQMQSLQVNQTLAPALPEIVVPKQTNKAQMGDDDMPELEDDPLFVTAEKAKPDNLPKAEQDERFAKLEKKLKQLQESRNSLPFDLSVYEKVNMPKKFKMPEFEKYDGTSCPKAHLQMYHVRMAQYVKNEPLMIQSFHASLTGPALNWYIMKNELMKLFVKTLPYEFRNRMASTYVENFNQLIPVGEQIEMGLRDGWFNEPTHQGKRFTMKKDKEPATEINVAYAQPAPSKPQMVRIPGNQQDGGQVPAPRQFTKRQFSPLPGPLSQHKIQNLLDTKAFSFRTTQLNVQKNPLSEHQGNVNAIFEFNAGKKMNLKVSVKDIYRGLVKVGYYPTDENPPLPTMKERVQEMVKAGMIVYADQAGIVSTISEVVIDWEKEFAKLSAEKSEPDPLIEDMPPLEDASDHEGLIVEVPSTDEEIIIEMPQLYEYKDNKAVPWSYELDVDLITRSGRTYAQANAQPAKPVTDEEAKEFLAIIKASEYNVVDQLRKLPAQISLLELLQTSPTHQKSLMKVLSEVHVLEMIDVNRLEEFVGSILLKDLIAFSDEEFPLEGRGHTKALYISVKCKASHVARVLIDNGSALNICPLATLHRLKIDPSKINAAKTSVRAFDGTRKEVIGETHLELQIGPVMFNVLFRGAVPSSLHQSVKFVVEGKLVIVHGEEDHWIYHEMAIPYIEPERREE